MPAVLKLEAPASQIDACAYKITDSRCVTESGTYNYTHVIGPDKPKAEVLAQTPFRFASAESIVLVIGSNWLRATTVLIDSIVRSQSRAPEVMLSVAEVRGDDLIDVLSPKSLLSVTQGDDAVYRMRGWSQHTYERVRSKLELPGSTARIVQVSLVARKVTFIELPINEGTRSTVKALHNLVALLAGSGDAGKTYFPYRDSVVSKLLWACLSSSPQALNALFCLPLDAPRLPSLLALGDQLTRLMTSKSSKQGALRPPLKVDRGDLKHEVETLSELVRQLKQRRTDAHAAAYAERQREKQRRALIREQERKATVRALESRLASLEAEYRRKMSALSYDERQQEAWHIDREAAPRHHRIQKELESAKATLQTCEKELAANKAALVAALSLTPAERARGNIRQAEYNLRSLKAQCARLSRRSTSHPSA